MSVVSSPSVRCMEWPDGRPVLTVETVLLSCYHHCWFMKQFIVEFLIKAIIDAHIHASTGSSFFGEPEVTKSSTSFGWGKGWNDTSAGWQVTVCDPIWHEFPWQWYDANCYTHILYFCPLWFCFSRAWKIFCQGLWKHYTIVLYSLFLLHLLYNKNSISISLSLPDSLYQLRLLDSNVNLIFSQLLSSSFPLAPCALFYVLAAVCSRGGLMTETLPLLVHMCRVVCVVLLEMGCLLWSV